ncbi:hypothetical protein FNW02_30785 [Komarekiella sp. 'clone 1']|uniref:Uncharacterized protein n=1 Tax=Komarekiella delphini-convector SJRDD-AB1 TaxID=2593771 RepID=A0AA40T353_9NOST|nr:hypothetical protein [Komarekiella delphini-convector]MBD6620066.1 hypothetical protein [Komarekiella delphini-convector SJRDD-AB1]
MPKTLKPQPEPPKNEGLNLSDLNGDVSKALVFKDSHFGLESAVWENAQRIADMLPVNVRTFGDLTDEHIALAAENAKGAEIQLKNWTEYDALISRYLKALIKNREKQASVAENVGEARVTLAQMEKNLGVSLANLESKFRQIVGGSRSALAGVQDDLEISLGKIASQYSEGKAKKQEKLQAEKTKKEPTPYEEQTSNLVTRFQELRNARYSGTPGITQRIRKE